MSTRLLKDLEARALEAKDDNERLQIRAERAGALARLGRIAAARGELTELRRLNSAFHPAVAGWILFSEGLIEHFEALAPSALDKFNRAYAIGVGLGDRRLIGEGAAWISVCELRKGRYAKAVERALEAIGASNMSDHLARSRAHLVLADSLNAAGERHGAQENYRIARSHAVNCGDLTMQSAILHNQAADSLGRLTLSLAVGLSPDDEPKQVELEVESVLNLDSGAGIRSLPASTQILGAQLGVVRGAYDDALRKYNVCLEPACSEGLGQWRARFLADCAYCAAKLGQLDRAREHMEACLAHLSELQEDDDLAIAHSRIAFVLSELGDSERSAHHKDAASRHFELFRQDQNRLRATLPTIVKDEKKNPA